MKSIVDASGEQFPVDHPLWRAHSENSTEVEALVVRAEERKKERLAVPCMTGFRWRSKGDTTPDTWGQKGHMPQHPLDIRFTDQDSATTVVVAVGGEFDAETGPQLRDVLIERIDCGARAVVVDLGEVTFIDSVALGVLVMVARRLAPGAVVLASAQGQIASIFEATHLNRVFDIFPTTEEAIAHVAACAADAAKPEVR